MRKGAKIMNDATKKGLSAGMIVFTVSVVIICLVIALYYGSNSYYRVMYKLEPEILNAEAICIGDTYYNKKSMEDHLFYQIEITLRNDSNIPAEQSSTSYYYDPNTYGYVEILHDNGFLGYSDTYLIPPGEIGKVKAIVEIPGSPSKLSISSLYDYNMEVIIDLKR